MKTKLIFSSLVLAGIFASCSDEFAESNEVKSSLDGRAKINLTLSNGTDVSTRVTPDGESAIYDQTDFIGGVIVDSKQIWTVDELVRANNKWGYNSDTKQFTTAGTTSIGSWLFYTPYNPKMTTTTQGVEYNFFQIQEGATDFTEIAKSKVDFFVSPVVELDGYEGENRNFALSTPSINSRVAVQLELPAGAAQVQKVVVKATDVAGMTVKFPTEGKIDNTKVPTANICTTTDGTHFANADITSGRKTADGVIKEATDKIMNLGTYAYAGGATPSDVTYFHEFSGDRSSGSTVKDYLVLDCTNHDTKAAMPVTSNLFKAWMLIPAGNYKTITLYAYTDKGVYEYVVKSSDMSVVTPNVEDFTLRRATRVNLATVKAAYADAGFKANYLKGAVKKTYAELLSAGTTGVVAVNTVDLVNVIKGIDANAAITVNVISEGDNHRMVIDQSVATALDVILGSKANAELNFTGDPVFIKGNDTEATPLVLKHMTFATGCVVESGFVKIGNNVSIPAGQKMTVNAGAIVDFATAQTTPKVYTEVLVKGTVNVTATTATTISTIVNENGTINVSAPLFTTNTAVTNNGTINVTEEGKWFASAFTNAVKNVPSSLNAGILVNNGSVTFGGTSANNATITNNMEMLIAQDATFTNNGQITNEAGRLIVNAKTDGTNPGILINKGTVDNKATMACQEATNSADKGSILNGKTINAMTASSTTYITENSYSGLGTITLSDRNTEVSVTTAAEQGTISWIYPSTSPAKFVKAKGDKFNKIILSSGSNIDLSEVNANITPSTKVISIEIGISETITLPDNATFKALTVTSGKNVTLNCSETSVGNLSIAKGAKLVVPTGNRFGAYKFASTTDTSNAVDAPSIYNDGSMTVGGDFFTTLDKAGATGGGEFLSGGSGNAYHWSAVDAAWN